MVYLRIKILSLRYKFDTFLFTDVVNLITPLVRIKFETECELCKEKNKIVEIFISCSLKFLTDRRYSIQYGMYHRSHNLFFKTYFSASRQS